jgi:N-acetylmuramoyl-L-alanine amidase
VQEIVLSETASGLEVHVTLASAGDCDVFALDAYADKPFRVVIDVPRSTPGSRPPASGAPPSDAPPPGARPSTARPSTASVPTRPVRRIVVDPGHGGEDWGTRGYGGLVEKKLTLDISRRVVRLLNAPGTGCEATLTRDDDTFVGLGRRVRLAQTKGADLFVSVHANSSPNSSARGVEIFFVSLSQATDQASQELADKENAAHLIGVDSLAASEDTLASEDLLGILLDMRQSETIGRSSSLAEAIISSYRAGGEVPVRGVKQAGFQVLRSVVVPSVLVEVGFVTNVEEGKRLLRPEYRDRIAGGIASGVMSFLSTETGMRIAE